MQGNKMYGDDMIFNENIFPHEVANNQLEGIWKEEYCKKNSAEKIKILRPLDIHKLKKEAILFIGINPSFSEVGFNKILKESSWKNFDPNEFYGWQSKSFNTEKAEEIEKLARDRLVYFSKFKEIAKHVTQCTDQEVEVEWEHLDLFFERQTSQKDFKKNIFVHKGELRQFYKKQLEVTKLLIKYIEPRVIVIANALASEIYRDNNDYIGEFDPSVGHHFQTIGDTQTPIFFSSMLTGQRALDNNSYERLTWHICRNFNNSKCKCK